MIIIYTFFLLEPLHSMLAYFHDYQIENYDWFFRIDDDTVVQWNNLNEFLRGLHIQQNCNISSIRMFLTLTLSE